MVFGKKKTPGSKAARGSSSEFYGIERPWMEPFGRRRRSSMKESYPNKHKGDDGGDGVRRVLTGLGWIEVGRAFPPAPFRLTHRGTQEIVPHYGLNVKMLCFEKPPHDFSSSIKVIKQNAAAS